MCYNIPIYYIFLLYVHQFSCHSYYPPVVTKLLGCYLGCYQSDSGKKLLITLEKTLSKLIHQTDIVHCLKCKVLDMIYSSWLKHSPPSTFCRSGIVLTGIISHKVNFLYSAVEKIFFLQNWLQVNIHYIALKPLN